MVREILPALAVLIHHSDTNVSLLLITVVLSSKFLVNDSTFSPLEVLALAAVWQCPVTTRVPTNPNITLLRHAVVDLLRSA